ncbi:hypothetical protein [Epilithonimonas caeni]|uniref:hypothetical protein n=1 Tax=Epilithonimonas caeni TaxID=365343 RepID=UPI000424AEB5|nr:hypothetical protein [Epilithonimonas caeni]
MKKFKIFILTVVIISTGKISAQSTYVDVTTTAAMVLYAENMKAEQEKVVEQQSKLQQAQTWVGTQMVAANDIQNKVLKGLREVSGTLSNGIQIKNILTSLQSSYKYTSDVLNIVSSHPQYSIFGVKSSEKVYTSAADIVTEYSDIIKSDELNLATAGDRSKLLNQTLQKVMILEMWILDVKLRLERAIRIGFWKSANPFQGYVDADKSIVEGIMNQYKWNF